MGRHSHPSPVYHVSPNHTHQPTCALPLPAALAEWKSASFLFLTLASVGVSALCLLQPQAAVGFLGLSSPLSAFYTRSMGAGMLFVAMVSRLCVIDTVVTNAGIGYYSRCLLQGEGEGEPEVHAVGFRSLQGFLTLKDSANRRALGGLVSVGMSIGLGASAVLQVREEWELSCGTETCCQLRRRTGCRRPNQDIV